jgi:hypothetical protein
LVPTLYCPIATASIDKFVHNTFVIVKIKNVLSILWKYKNKKCKYKRVLEFDNSILNQLPVNLLIEYDGEYHFMDVRNNKKCYKAGLLRDIIKNQFCLEEGFLLLRISYLEYDDIEKWIKFAIEKAKLGETGIIFSNPALYRNTYIPSMKQYKAIYTIQKLFRCSN